MKALIIAFAAAIITILPGIYPVESVPVSTSPAPLTATYISPNSVPAVSIESTVSTEPTSTFMDPGITNWLESRDVFEGGITP